MIEPPLYTILNIDDDDAGRHAKSRILQLAGYRVLESSSGADALGLVAEMKPQLVLVSGKLAGMSGLDVCRTIKTNPSTGAVLVLQIAASRIAPEDQVFGPEGGADAYLTEPLDANEAGRDRARVAASLQPRKRKPGVSRCLAPQ